MFYEVKVINPQGKIKKVVSSKELAKRHWKDFFITSSENWEVSSNKQRVPGWMKKKLDIEYAPLRRGSIYY